MTINERAALVFLSHQPEAHLDALQAEVFGDLGTGTSPARNTIRRLVKHNYIERVAKGTYSITEKGEKKIPASVALETLKENGVSLSVDSRKVEQFLRLALRMLMQEGIYERRGDERRQQSRRGPDRRAMRTMH